MRFAAIVTTAIGVAGAAGAASAACLVTGPAAMYLGAGGAYTIQVKVDRGDACRLNFNPLRPDVRIARGAVVTPARSGVVNMDALVAKYVPGPAAADHFTLEVCGTDTRGTGCNRLIYRVVVR